MAWYICLALAAAVMLLALKLAFDKSAGRLRALYVLACCLAATYLLYIPPLFEKYEISVALFGGIVNALRVISLDADYFAFLPVIKSGIEIEAVSSAYYFFLAAMHTLLPVVSALTAVTLIVQYMTALQLKALRRKKRPLHIFSALNYESVLLARDVRKNDKKCDILFLDSKEESDQTELKRSLKCSVLSENVENIVLPSKNRQIFYYLINEDREVNLSDTLFLLSRRQDKDIKEQQNTFLYLFTTNPTAEIIIDSVPKGHVNLKIVDKHRTAVYELLDKYPLVKYGRDKTIHMLICGFGAVGSALLRAAAWIGQLSGYTLKVTVLGKNAEDDFADFKDTYPNLFCERYDINLLSYKNEAEFTTLLRLHAADAGYVAVCCDDSETAALHSVKLRRFFYRADPEFKNAPPIFTYMENEEKAAALLQLKTAEAKAERRMSYDIIPFGMAGATFSFDNITDSDIERLSKNVHLVYEDIFSDGPIDVVEALQRYNLFEVNKSSNRANAMHIRYKLLMLGLDYTDDASATQVNLFDYLTDDTLEALTLAEHDRWMSFLDAEGWEGATVEQSLAYQASGISRGRHNCPLLKLHPYICPFEELPACSEALGLPDSTVYDRELIRRIPDILGDKWGASGKKYKIIKYN